MCQHIKYDSYKLHFTLHWTAKSKLSFQNHVASAKHLESHEKVLVVHIIFQFLLTFRIRLSATHKKHRQ